ncbi:hypothetical protein CDAR_30121 [Caerostris darwini]|uniref:Uncharacterized protein n=1 Tax=Caerostris darwini TaxID=1538125 RepID=A0AAV4TIA9_9ARAC|nr:hypothetical protein CDAR_30121 [Caerostris darwini]
MILPLLCIMLDFFGGGAGMFPLLFFVVCFVVGSNGTKIHHLPQHCPKNFSQHDIEAVPCNKSIRNNGTSKTETHIHFLADVLYCASSVCTNDLVNSIHQSVRDDLDQFADHFFKDSCPSRKHLFQFRTRMSVYHTLFSFADALHELQHLLPLKNE